MDPASNSGRPLPQYAATITFVSETLRRGHRIDLNTASIEELARLRGIGPATAKRIVTARGQNEFRDPTELVTRGLVRARFLPVLLAAAAARVNDVPNVAEVTTSPEHAMYHEPFVLSVAFDDSASGVRLARLELDSLSHSIDVARSPTAEESERQRIDFDMPAMEDGPMDVQVTLYDAKGNKAYLARTIQIFHNPPTVNPFPSERSARLSSGAALFKSDGNFHCDSSWSIVNGTSSPTSLNRVLTWRILDQGGGVLHSGVWDYGATITLAPFQVSSGWWFTFAMPPGSSAFDRLRNKEQIRIEWTFRELATNAAVVFSLTWRAIVAVNVNIIRVGEENFSTTERTLAFNALRQSASSIYQAQDIDVGTISTFIVPLAQANNHETIDSDGEAEDLTGDWTVPNQAIDMFVVRSYVGSTAGLSPVGGPCDKNAKGMTGSVIELQSSQALTGIVMAHELGHYLGLSHTSTLNNVMNPSVGTSNTVLTTSQGNTMKGFGCFLRFV
jgi:hypothetical protein